MAASYRLMALAKVLQNRDGEHWTLNVDGREYKLVNEALFRAAAIAPLQQPKFVGEVSFNLAELLEIALQQAHSEGSA